MIFSVRGTRVEWVKLDRIGCEVERVVIQRDNQIIVCKVGIY